MNLKQAKTDAIVDLIQKEIDGVDINGEKAFKYLRYFDILMYAKERKLKYKLDDIGRSQKVDLIKSLVKHNEQNR
jgi:hypothetical protein